MAKKSTIPEKTKLNKAQVMEVLAGHFPEDWTQADINTALNGVLGGLKEILSMPNTSASLVGFGTLSNKPYGRKERQGRNPATGETITVPARNGAKPHVKFSPGFVAEVEAAWDEATKPKKPAKKKGGKSKGKGRRKKK